MCGDYEFETRSYGISGASGRFCLKIEKKTSDSNLRRVIWQVVTVVSGAILQRLTWLYLHLLVVLWSCAQWTLSSLTWIYFRKMGAT